MKVYLHSFGCRVNQYEGERLRTGFAAGGSTIVQDWNGADISVINTCSVTDEADKEARYVIRRIMRDNPSGRVIITGCYASRDPRGLQALFPEALIVANAEKDSIPSLAGCSLGMGEAARGTSISDFLGKSRAWVKVQDGCDMACSYCIIPATRPHIRSRAPAEILEEIKALLESGYKEIVLCGIRLGRYWAPRLNPLAPGAKQEKWIDLLALIQMIAALPGDFRIRLSSIEISDMTDRFLEGYVSMPKTVPYFHIPLQSGSDAVLRAMNRWYDTKFYRNRLAAVRRALGQNAAIFTDFMVGFPTETADDFKRSLEFARACDFAGMHIFRYSSREGTPAARMSPVYSREELDERLEQTRRLNAASRAGFASRFTGKTLAVLAEGRKQGIWRARAENFLEVIGTEMKEGWQNMVITGTKGPTLTGSFNSGFSIPLSAD